jgi:hypothetical protein
VKRLGYLIGALLIVSGLVHLGVLLVTGGTWTGPVSYRKPMTFGLSFGVTLLAVTWVVQRLRMRRKDLLLGIFAADCVLEVTGITVQAWRHVPSHFNTSTPIDRTVAMSLAVGGAVLVVVLGSMAVAVLRGRVDGGADLRLALRAGFVFLMIGLAAGVVMIARGTTLVNTGHPQQAYDTGGFLKPLHFVTLHAIVVLPALAVLLDRRGWDEPRRNRAVKAATWAYTAASVGALVVSLA